MLTLSGQSSEENAMSEESQRLKDIMMKNLRKSDIFSQYSTTQYFLIIEAPKTGGIETAIERIIRYFDREKTHPEISISKKIKNID